MLRAVFAGLILLTLLASLAAAEGRTVAGGRGKSTRPVAMTATPQYVLRACRASALLAPACPRRLPRTSPGLEYSAGLCKVGAAGCAGLTWDDLHLQVAGNGERPPVWVHVAIFAGDFTRFHYPEAGATVGVRDGLFGRSRTKALLFGRFRWGGKLGTLALVAPYLRGGEQGDHVIFVWHTRTSDYVIGLHAWEPSRKR